MNAQAQHPRHQLDEVIHSPVRLSILAILAAAGETDFKFLRDTIELSDSLLSKHISTLDEAGYVNVAKQFSGKRVSTWYSLTDLGRQRFGQYKETLDRILGGAPSG